MLTLGLDMRPALANRITANVVGTSHRRKGVQGSQEKKKKNLKIIILYKILYYYTKTHYHIKA